MARWFLKIMKFAKEIGKEVIVNLLADWLKSLLIVLATALLGTGVFIWVVRFLRKEISLQIPIGAICIFAGFWVSVPLIITLVMRRRKLSQPLPMYESDGLLWRIDSDKVVGGPFCPVCEEPLEPLPRHLDKQTTSLLRGAQVSSYPEMRLRCLSPKCGFHRPFDQSLETLRQRAESRASIKTDRIPESLADRKQ